jgi:hypothetical protein
VTRRPDHPTRRGLLAATPPALLGVAAAGCNHRDRRKAGPYLPSVDPETEAYMEPDPPPPFPPEPTEGRLVAGHEAALGRPGTRPEEPLAPPGEWVWSTYKLWKPSYLPWSVYYEIEAEIARTVPRHPATEQPLAVPPGPKPGTRVVLLPGPAFALGSLLAAGLYAPAIWDEGDGTFSDVIWLGLTDAATRAAVPEGHPYRLYAPAAAHELGHQHADPHGDSHRERAGIRCAGCEVRA